MQILTELLKEVEDYLAASGLSATAFGRRAVNDGHLVRRMRAGRNITLATVERVRATMRAAPLGGQSVRAASVAGEIKSPASLAGSADGARAAPIQQVAA